MASKDYYNILGVEKGASQDEIKKAYRRLAHQYHPDKGKGGDEQKFKEVNEAYQVLGDENKRAQYDRFGSTFDGAGPGGFDFSQFSQQGGFGGAGANFEINLEDIFGDIFGGATGARRRRGKDIVVDLELTLEEAFRGTVKEIEVLKFVTCTRCEGGGAEPGSTMKTCEDCGGSGETRDARRTMFGMFSQVRTCQTCNGEGSYPKKACKECGGDGRVRNIESLSVPVPAGVDDGSAIKVGGKGEVAPRGGVPGDLIARLSIAEHNLFTREGADLYSTAQITFPQAVFGTTVTVDTIDGGEETLSIPKGTQSGTELRLKGKGMPTGRGSRGDHIVTVAVETPQKVSKKAKKLLEELEDEL